MRRTRPAKPIANNHSILTSYDTDLFLHVTLAELVVKRRPRSQAELAEQQMPFRMDDVRIPIASQSVSPARDLDFFVDLRNQQMPSGSRMRSCNQEPVISAAIRTDNRRRRVSAEAVWEEPLEPLCTLEVVENRGTEVEQAPSAACAD